MAPRILHIFPSFELGGSQRRMVTYLNETQAVLDHMVYALDNNYEAAALTDNFIKADIPANIVPRGDTLKAVKICRSLIAEIKPDLLVTYNWGSIEWALANRWPKRVPMIHIQDGFAEDEQRQEKNNRRRLRRFAYRTCNRVVVPSRQLETIARESWHIRTKRLQYIPNGIDTSRFEGKADTSLLRQFDLKPDDTIVGTVARLNHEKNIGRLIEAFSAIENKHTNAKLVIVGDGVGMSALKMLAERICEPGRVVFTGQIDQPEKILPAFDIFSLSSDTEQMPISVLEAMAASKPVASTNVGDIKQMVSAENQGFIDGNEAEQLASSLDTLLADPALASNIGHANARVVKERYSLSGMVESYDTLFAETSKS